MEVTGKRASQVGAGPPAPHAPCLFGFWLQALETHPGQKLQIGPSSRGGGGRAWGLLMGWGGKSLATRTPRTPPALPPPQLFCFVSASEGAFNWGGKKSSAVKTAFENQCPKE